jgi:hypothetical protein
VGGSDEDESMESVPALGPYPSGRSSATTRVGASPVFSPRGRDPPEVGSDPFGNGHRTSLRASSGRAVTFDGAIVRSRCPRWSRPGGCSASALVAVRRHSCKSGQSPSTGKVGVCGLLAFGHHPNDQILGGTSMAVAVPCGT